MGLPLEPSEYVASDRDYVACLYDCYTKKPDKTKYWNMAVLDAQRVAAF